MSTSDFLVRLDALGLAATGWIATWFVHSLMLCALALLLGRVLRVGSLREALYKVALVGALVTSGAQAFGVGVGESLSYELSASSGAGRPIGIAGAGSAPARRAAESRAPERAARSTSDPAVAVNESGARWRWAHLVTLAALVAALAGAASLLREQRRLRRAIAGRLPVEHDGWNADLRELVGDAGLPKTPRLTSSQALGSPIALARGELVVPERALKELDPDARRALLAHELAHLARRDPHWLVATAILERVLAIQPLQRLVRARLVDEIELACDAQAVDWTGDGLPLARCLATVAGWVTPEPAPALVASMAARDSALVRRVERALAPTSASTTTAQRRVFCLSLAAMLALLACSGPKVEPADAAEAPDAPAETSTVDEQQIESLRALGYVGDDEPATLEFTSDGRILAAELVLYEPGDDFERLDAHLAELVEGMETQPLDEDHPDGFQLAMGELVLHAAEGAPMRNLQKAMERCGVIGIWRLRFTGDWPGGKAGYDVPLPSDLDGMDVPVEEGSLQASIESEQAAQLRRKVQVTMRVIQEGAKLDPVSGAPWDGTRGSRFVFDDTRALQYEVGTVQTSSLAEVARLLMTHHEQQPQRGLTIDARKGTVYRDVVDVLDAGLAAGFEEITFVGSYE